MVFFFFVWDQESDPGRGYENHFDNDRVSLKELR